MQNREHLSRLHPIKEFDHHQLALETGEIEQALQNASGVRVAAALLLAMLRSVYWTSCICRSLPALSVSMLSYARIPDLGLRAETVKTTASRVRTACRGAPGFPDFRKMHQPDFERRI